MQDGETTEIAAGLRAGSWATSSGPANLSAEGALAFDLAAQAAFQITAARL
jgi:hypothetical protein